MDQEALVKIGHILIDCLEAKGVRPRAAVWAHSSDLDTWKLWIVPHAKMKDQREFYRKVAESISEHSEELKNLSIGDVEMVLDSHPAIQALSRIAKVTDKSSVHLENVRLNDFYLPDGIILLMSL